MRKLFTPAVELGGSFPYLKAPIKALQAGTLAGLGFASRPFHSRPGAGLRILQFFRCLFWVKRQRQRDAQETVQLAAGEKQQCKSIDAPEKNHTYVEQHIKNA